MAWLNSPLITSCLLISEGFSPSSTSLLTSCCQLGGSVSRSFSNCSSSLWLSPKAMLSNLIHPQTNVKFCWGLQGDNGDPHIFCVCSCVYGCTYVSVHMHVEARGWLQVSSLTVLHLIPFDSLVRSGFFHGSSPYELRSSHFNSWALTPSSWAYIYCKPGRFLHPIQQRA